MICIRDKSDSPRLSEVNPKSTQLKIINIRAKTASLVERSVKAPLST